ncbi:DUF6473 family protein [Ruegeria sp.]|uniref:DUF6473 family protein n=1 Tax=Ruegeria sp. TaxID=1879320 RepID=UPI003C7A35B3
MSYQPLAAGGAAESICTYDGSNLPFRGPQRVLDAPYTACIGSTETFGRFVDRPFPSVLESRLGSNCINLGSMFCGVEAMSQDAGLLTMANAAKLCVLQLPGVLEQSNPFYRVHPRRNDRFLCPTPEMVALYPEVDFTDVHFVRHLASRLQSYQDARFDIVADALCESWVTKIRAFLGLVKTPVIVLWLKLQSDTSTLNGHAEADPIRIDASMANMLRPFCAELVSLPVRLSGNSDELEDMLFGTLQQPIAERMIGPATHRRIADVLAKAVQDLQ